MSEDVNDVLGVAYEALHQAHVQANHIANPQHKTAALLDVVDRAIRLAEALKWADNPANPSNELLSLGSVEYRDGVLGSRMLAEHTEPKLWEGKD